MTPLNKLIDYIDSYKDDIVNQQTIRNHIISMINDEREMIEDAVNWGWLWRITGEEYYDETFKNNKYHGNTKKESKGIGAETSQTSSQKVSKIRKASNKKGK